jgi:predicted DNA-binding transcriptional regulator AlpA
MDVRLLKRHEVCLILSTSSAGLARGMADGRYPRPYRTGVNSVRWKNCEVQMVIDNLTVAVPVEVAPGVRKGRKPKITEIMEVA